MTVLHRHRIERAQWIVARFADLDAARSAIETLEDAGLDGVDIHVLGLTTSTPTREQTRTADWRITKFLTRRIIGGIMVGELVGIIVGAIAGLLLLAITEPASRLGQSVAVTLAGFGLCATLGALISFERAGTLSDAWPDMFFDPSGGSLWVGAHTHDTVQHQRALDKVQKLHPLELRERLPPGG